MKGLSIEEKAKAYDEAIERAKNFIENGDERERTIAESIFAGIMEESEDERIRKALIRFHKSTIDVDGIKGEDIIAWLEKQGEHANFRNKIQIGDKVTRNKDGVLVNLSQLKRVAKKDEKQGKQKPTLPKWKYKKDHAPLLRDSIILNKYGCVAKSPSGALVSDVWVMDYDELVKLPKEEIENQGEQKPAYTKEYDFHGMKFIPKFAKGDIIKDKKRDEVSTIEDFSYDTGLYTHTYGQFPITIQDNYEIIEQNPADKVERKGMNLVEEEMTPFQKKVFCIIDTTIEEEQGLKQVCDELLRLAHDEIMQKSAWSEEDESMLQNILECLKNGWRKLPTDILKYESWLKSLRPQNRWKPSDEQMKALGKVLKYLVNAKGETVDGLKELEGL